MEKIGIICEYNPFHNGHIYHIEKIKELYPDSIIILVLNGYFLERGQISIISKKDKTKIALDHNIDIVLELPTLYGSQSADIFAYHSIKILNELHVDKIIFGSESNDINTLKQIASIQNDEDINQKIKTYLKQGLNYPTSLAKAINKDFNYLSNDLLGISYIKAINKINDKIIPMTIQRTNNYLDIKEDNNIISAQNIRNRINNHEDISSYVPKNTINYINNINYDLYFKLLKNIILTNDHLEEILDVDEGIHHLLKKEIINSYDLDDFINKISSKRYTLNKINRMLIHILLNIKKEDNLDYNDYFKILGFNTKGKKYLNSIKKDIKININKESFLYKLECNAASIYDMLTDNNDNIKFELSKKPIIKK